jgi:hypothetical protein
MDGLYFLQASGVQEFSQNDPLYLLNVEILKDLSFLHVSYPRSTDGMSSGLQDSENSYTKTFHFSNHLEC